MKIIDLSKENERTDTALVTTVGFFDGVHLGHRHLISQVKAEALRLNLPSAVITFPVHPRKVLQSEYQPSLISGYDEKMSLLSTTGIDYCISLPFTVELSRLSAFDFMNLILKEIINVDTLFVGYDHRFGYNRAGGYEVYKRYGEEIGINVVLATEFQLDGEHNVSSSQIRRLLKSGKIKDANRLLSYNYTISGKIVEGYKVGRTIGFPTANIQLWERCKVMPAMGVYAVQVHMTDKVYPGMLYIGTRSTLHEDSPVSVEVNIFNFEGDLYGRSMSIEFIDFVRSDEKFNSKEELVARIHCDKEEVERILREIPG